MASIPVSLNGGVSTASAALHSTAASSTGAVACAASHGSGSSQRCSQAAEGSACCSGSHVPRPPLPAVSSASSPSAAVIPFPFPFPPYPQQYALMRRVFDTLRLGPGHVCVVESPTGTGKSLSLISSCLYWLLEHHPREEARARAAADVAAAPSAHASDTPDPMSWVSEQHAALQTAAQRQREREAAILQANITRQMQKRAAEEDKHRRQASKAEARRKAERGGDDDDDLLPLDTPAGGGGSSASSSLPFALQLELDDLLEKQADTDKLLRDLVTAPGVSYERKVAVILERQARAARIAALTGSGGAEGGAASGAGSSSAASGVDELGTLLSRMLSGDRPRRKPQLIYASRTHSQLIQFVSELRKTKYGQRAQVTPNVIPAATAPPPSHVPSAPSSSSSSLSACSSSPSSPPLSLHERANAFDPALCAKVVSLGSRANLCIHPLTQHLKQSPMQLNDVCVEMQKNQSEQEGTRTSTVVAIDIDRNKLPTRAQLTSQACPYLDPRSLDVFHNQTLIGGVYDLEQLPPLGVTLHFCPYYGTRTASPEADVLVLPYASLLSASTRAALNIDVSEAVIVVDEAHNLHDTLNALHSCVLPWSQLRRAISALRLYRARFDRRLMADNLTLLNQLIQMAEGFKVALIRGHGAARKQQEREATQAGGGTGGGGGKEGSTRVLDDFIGQAVDLSSEPTSTMGAAASTASSAAPPNATRSTGLPPSIQRHLAGNSTASVSSPPSTSSFVSPPRRSCTYSLLKTSNAFASSFLIDDINPHVVARWVTRHKMEQKIKGYLDRYPQETEAGGGEGEGGVTIHTSAANRKFDRVGAIADSEYESSSLSPLTPVMALITALNNADADGRIAIDIVMEHPQGEGGSSGGIHPQSCLRFLHLNPSLPLEPILAECRTLILAGGTMAPFDAFRTQIFPTLQQQHPERIHMEAFGHVVPREHIQALIVRAGPPIGAGGGGGGSGDPVELCFTHARRSDPRQMDSLGEAIVQLLALVPGGVVAFFSSYAVEADMVAYWSTHGSGGVRVYASIEQAADMGEQAAMAGNTSSTHPTTAPHPQPQTWLERMRARKCVFREPRSSGGIEHVLAHYTRIIEEAEAVAAGKVSTTAANGSAASAASPPRLGRVNSVPHGGDASSRRPGARSHALPSFTDSSLRPGQSGGLLFAVVGGKLSEGINFSDGLARAVLMVGLPFPNRHEASMQEKIKYLDQQEARWREAEQEKRRQEAKTQAEGGATPSPSAPPLPVSSGSVAGRSSAGSRYVHTLCMRAVNQSIGRAIRHRNDYACIILLDVRYTQRDVWQALPTWLTHAHTGTATQSQSQTQTSPSVAIPPWGAFKPEGVTFSEARMAVSRFFAYHRLRTSKNAAGSISAAPVVASAASVSRVSSSVISPTTTSSSSVSPHHQRAPPSSGPASLPLPLPQKRKADAELSDAARSEHTRPSKWASNANEHGSSNAIPR